MNEDFGLNKKYTLGDIDLLDFEIDEDGYSINLYPMNPKNTQLGCKMILPEYPNGFLRDLDLDIDEDYYDFNDDADMDRMDEFYDKLQKNVISWFSECWQKAGGSNTNYKFYIASHDLNKSFDLKSQKWINNKNN